MAKYNGSLSAIVQRCFNPVHMKMLIYSPNRQSQIGYRSIMSEWIHDATGKIRIRPLPLTVRLIGVRKTTVHQALWRSPAPFTPPTSEQ